MRYKIKEIAAHQGLSVNVPLEPELLREVLGEVATSEPASGVAAITMHIHEGDIWVTGEVSARLPLTCGACLSPMVVELRVPVKQLFVYGDATAAAAKKAAVSDDELDETEVVTHDGKEIDLEPLVREQLIVNLPMAARCRIDCAGLCPVCGADANVTNCQHDDVEHADVQRANPSPFAALAALKENLKLH